MAISFTPTYTNKRQFVYDVAASTGKLDSNTFNAIDANSVKDADKYLDMVAGTAGKTSDTFNWNDYNLLSGTENQALYLYQTYYADKNETATEKDEKTGKDVSYNVYDRNQQYLDYVLQQARDKKFYESLSGFEKTMATIGGILADTANAVYGTIEGVLDAITLAGGTLADVVTFGLAHKDISEGTKWAISQDVTGTGFLQNQINDFKAKYTAIDKNNVIKAIDDVAVAIGQMVPMFVGGQPVIGGKITAGYLTYMGSAAGKTAQSAIEKNPDIDLWSVAAYTSLVSAVEIGTEWASGKIFGGLDTIARRAGLASGSSKLISSLNGVKGFLARTGLNFVSEGLEESIAEFVDSILDVVFVGGDSKIASIEEILYAGLIGGVTGFLLTGGNIAGTRRLAVTDLGDLAYYKDIKKSGAPYKKLSRLETMNLQESLSQARIAMRENAVEDFYVTYEQQGLTREQAQTQHADEYNEAVKKKAKTDKTISDAVVVLSKALEWGGQEKFIKAAELANYTIEQKSQLIREYAEYTPSSNEKTAIVEKLIQNRNPGSNAKINDNLTAGQLKIKDTFKGFGIDLYYADYGEADGNRKYHDPVLDDKTVVLDMRDFENASYTEVLDKVAKKTLVRTLQYKSGVLDKANIIKLQQIISKRTNYLDSTFEDARVLGREDVSKLSDADLKVYAEKQANTLSQMLLFDELTINKLFVTDTNIFKKMYDWLGRTKRFFESFGRKNELNKRQYHTVLETMRKYQNSIADTSLNEQYMNDAIDDIGIDEENKKRIVQRYNPNTKSDVFAHWVYIPMSKTKRAQNYIMCMNTLAEMTSGKFTFDEAFNPEIYNPDIVAAVYARMKKGDSFQRALQDYLAENYDMMIDQTHEQLVEVTAFKEHVSAEYKQAIRDFKDGKITLDVLQQKFPTVGHMFEMEFIKSTYNEEENQTLFNWRLNFVPVNRAEYTDQYGETNLIDQVISVFIDPNQEGDNKLTEIIEMEHTIFHETQHVIAEWTNLPQGGSVDLITDILINPVNNRMMERLWNMTQDTTWEEEIANNTKEDTREKLAKYLYSQLAGELLAESTKADPTSIFGKEDYFDVFYDNGSIKLMGRGKFIGFLFSGKYDIMTILTKQQRYKKATPLDDVSGETTDDFKVVSKQRSYANDLKKLLDEYDVKENGNTYISGVGDAQATNDVIKILYPNNKFATTVEYVDKVRLLGLTYGQMYKELKTKLQPDPTININESHTFEEIKDYVDTAINSNSIWRKRYLDIYKGMTNNESLSELKRRRILKKDYDYSIQKTSEIMRDTNLEQAINKSKQKSLSAPVGEGERTVESVIRTAEDEFIEILDAELQGFEDPRVSETISQILPKIKESIDLEEAFDMLKSLVDYAKTVSSNDRQRIANLMKEMNWTSKKGYEKQINELISNLTEDQKTQISKMMSEFKSPLDYIELIEDIKNNTLNLTTQEQPVDINKRVTSDKTGVPKFDLYTNEELAEKGKKKTIEKMSPSEYIDEAFKLLYKKESPNISYNEWLKQQKQPRYEMKEFGDISNTDYFKNKIRNNELFEMPYLDYTNNSQEGLHRAMAAEDLGIKQIEVAVMEKIEKPVETQKISEEVLNKDGSFKTFYKGTNVPNITVFDSKKGAKKRITDSQWFTDKREVAETYANEKAKDATIYEVELQITNPKIIDAEGKTWNQAFNGKTTDEVVQEAINEGKNYDAVIIKNVIDVGTYGIYLEPATDIAVLDNTKIKIIKSTPKTNVLMSQEQKPVTKKTKKEQIIENSEKTLGIETLTKEEKQKAKEQTIDTVDLKIDENILNKRTELKNIMDMEDMSKYQGDTKNKEYTPAETKTIEKHEKFFASITSDELQPLLQSLAIELDDMASYASMVLLTRYAYKNRYTQFKDIKEFVKERNRLTTIYSASQMGGMSQLYGKRQVTEAIHEVEMQTGKSLQIPEATVLKALDNKYNSVEEYSKHILSEIEKLDEQIKNTEDAYKKEDLKDKLKDYQRIMDAIDSEDFAGILDGVLAQLENTEENVVQNQQKMSDICQIIVDFLLENSIIEDGKVTIGKKPSLLSPSAKEKIMNFWSGLTTFRYLAMLSSPKTAAKNAVSNTLVATKAILDNAISKKISKSHILEQQSQVSFTGEYDEAFANEVEKRYRARVEEKTKGDRYYKNQVNKIKADYAKSKNPLLKQKAFAAIDTWEKKMLQDKPWTLRRAMRNLKNTLAGGAGAILNECNQWLIAKYRGSIPAHEITQEQLLANIRKTNPDLANLYENALNGDKIAVLDLGQKLKVSLLNLDNPNNIIDVSIERANELFFKTDNWYTTVRSVMKNKHPGAVAILDLIFPFMRTTINTSAYIINHSPIGIVKSIFNMLQTKAVYRTDLSDAINYYYRKQFMNMKQAEYDNKNKNADEPKTYRFIQTEYDKWFSENVPQEVQTAINGGKYQQLLSVYNQMIKDGKISPGSIGASNPYARAQAFERLSQGLTGTAIMALGMLLAALTGSFDYDDDDDYLGAVIRIGDLKIPLDDLAPFTTMFTVGAMLTSSKNFSDNISRSLKTLADQSLFSIMDSAIAYSTDVWDFMGNQMINVTQQFIPSILKNIAKVADNAKKDKSGNWGINLLKTTASNLPLFSYLVPNKVNPYTGETEKYYEGGIFEALINQVSPISLRIEDQSQFEKDAIKYDAESKGFSGRFTINDKEYNITGKTKEKLAKYRANYLQTEYNKIANGNQLVTVEDDKGKKITTTYNQLSDKQKANVLKSLYTKASNITKIKYWIDQGNVYYTSNRDEYTRLRKTITNGIYYSANWRKSKFVER